ncbi:hypothetical protein CJF30_00006520 [Rutstroemia sp. NJR-2017a BBW]|nr:hypothetical protein CJF30_00006520 [Rutstroemia sp. NJR-2017a BBW]
MPSLGKRALRAGVIDLTGSDEENDVPQRKHPRVSASSSSQFLSTAPTSVRDQWLVGENGEESDIIDLSQDVEEGFGWVCLGAIDGKIVGIRYYHGYATPGEQVMIRREPSNPYDSNAIRVNNVQGTQIGHLPRQLAEKLAPYLDSKTIVLEATLAGEKGNFDCPVLLKVYGPGEPVARAELESKLKADRVPLKKRAVAAPKTAKAPVEPSSRKKLGYKSSQGSSMNALIQERLIRWRKNWANLKKCSRRCLWLPSRKLLNLPCFLISVKAWRGC